MPTITIPGPSGAFTVTIKDSTGTVVYGPSAETNAPFDPGITDPGTYTVYVDNEGAENGFCFTISECECPVLEEVTVTFDAGVSSYYGNLSFDMTGGLLCPFVIHITTAFTTGTFLINELGDFTSNVGDIYTKSFLIGGVGAMSYTVTINGGELCYEGNVTFDCIGPVLCADAGGDNFLLSPTNVSCTTWQLDLTVAECGVDCGDYTINYLQINTLTSGVPDSGTFSGVATCVGSCDPNPIPISPNMNIVGFTDCDGEVFPIYEVTYTDCCGNTETQTISLGVTP